jgi:hypothetical protein
MKHYSTFDQEEKDRAEDQKEYEDNLAEQAKIDALPCCSNCGWGFDEPGYATHHCD